MGRTRRSEIHREILHKSLVEVVGYGFGALSLSMGLGRRIIVAGRLISPPEACVITHAIISSEWVGYVDRPRSLSLEAKTAGKRALRPSLSLSPPFPRNFSYLARDKRSRSLSTWKTSADDVDVLGAGMKHKWGI